MADRNTRINGNQIKDATVTADELASSVAGDGLAGGAGSALSVNVDDSTIETNTDALRVKDAGITASKLAAAVAGNGLAGGAGSALSVNVDDSSIEINADTLRVKAGGIAASMLAESYVEQTDVDDSTIEFSGGTLNVKANGIGAAEIDETDNYSFSGAMSLSTAPSSDNDVANKAYVDSVAAGLAVHEPVRLATVAELDAAYDNGASGVGATLTNSGAQAALQIDGVTVVVADRIMVKDQATGSTEFENGIYVVTVVGTGATNWVLTRSDDYDDSPSQEIHDGDFFFVGEGNTLEHNGYVQTAVWTVSEVVGTDAITFEQFSGAGQIDAGDGLAKAGNVLSVNVDDSSIEINADTLRVKAGGIAASMLAESYVEQTDVDDSTIEFSGGTLNIKAAGVDTAQLAANAADKTIIAADVAGDGLGQAAGGELDVKVDDSSIEINSDTLRVKALGITNAMLAGSIADSKLSQITTANKVDGGSLVASSVVNGALVEDYIKQNEVDDDTLEMPASTLQIKDSGVATAKIADNAVDKDKINVDVAGDGLGQNVSGALEIKVDDSTVEINADTLRVKDLGVTNAKIANDTILEVKLDVTNSPTDGYVLSFDSGTGGFTWIAGASDSVTESDFVTSKLAPASGGETVLTSFSGSAAVVANSVQVYLNGLIQEEGASNDYTVNVSTGVVTFLTALEAGDIVIMNGVLNN